MSEELGALTQFRNMLGEWKPLWAKASELGTQELAAACNGHRLKLPRDPRLAELRAAINREITYIERLVKAVVQVRPFTYAKTDHDPFEALFEKPEPALGIVRDLIDRAIGEYTRRATNGSAEDVKGPAMSTSTIQIFVSHAGKDGALAGEFVQWLHGCLVVPGGDVIRCTSAAGHKLKIGDAGADVLREDIHSAKTVIGLMTDTSLASAYVLMELGAGWALKKHVGCLVRPGVKFEQIRGPIAELHATRLDAAHDLSDVADKSAEVTGFATKSGALRSVATERFLAFVAAMPSAAAAPDATAAAPAAPPIDDETATMFLRGFCEKHSDEVYSHRKVDAELALADGTTARLIATACPPSHEVAVAPMAFTLKRKPARVNITRRRQARGPAQGHCAVRAHTIVLATLRVVLAKPGEFRTRHVSFSADMHSVERDAGAPLGYFKDQRNA